VVDFQTVYGLHRVNRILIRPPTARAQGDDRDVRDALGRKYRFDPTTSTPSTSTTTSRTSGSAA